MTDRILEKINKHILNGINRESDVVYLLVQIRKILERENLKSAYTHLDLYCDWILHPKITNEKKSGQMLGQINSAVAALEDPDGIDHPAALENLNKAVSLVGLYGDMEKFFMEKNINNAIFNEGSWKKFGGLLIEILQDIPLMASGKQLISQFSITEALDISHSFRVRILLPDDRVYTGPMTSVVGANWDIGVNVISPSGPPSESDIDLYDTKGD